MIERFLNLVDRVTATEAHGSNTNNPHQTNAAQVGLGNVQNYAIAAQADAETGTRNDLYMTPLRTAQAIAKLAGAAFNAHVNNTNNPHSTTKAQVGLGNVQDYGMATNDDVNLGNAGSVGLVTDSKYVSPRKVLYAIYYWLRQFVVQDVTVSVTAGTWTKVCDLSEDYVFYRAMIHWGGTTSTNCLTYYAGVQHFGSLGGRHNPLYGNFGTTSQFDITNLQLAAIDGYSKTNRWEGLQVFGVGSYGEFCKIAMMSDGLYIYWDNCITNGGSRVTGSSCGAISINVRIERCNWNGGGL